MQGYQEPEMGAPRIISKYQSSSEEESEEEKTEEKSEETPGDEIVKIQSESSEDSGSENDEIALDDIGKII